MLKINGFRALIIVNAETQNLIDHMYRALFKSYLTDVG